MSWHPPGTRLRPTGLPAQAGLFPQRGAFAPWPSALTTNTVLYVPFLFECPRPQRAHVRRPRIRCILQRKIFLSATMVGREGPAWPAAQRGRGLGAHCVCCFAPLRLGPLSLCSCWQGWGLLSVDGSAGPAGSGVRSVTQAPAVQLPD